MSKNSKDENEGKSQRVIKKEKQRRHSDRQYNLPIKGTENYQCICRQYKPLGYSPIPNSH